MAPHDIIIDHPAAVTASHGVSVDELASACPPQGALADHIDDAHDGPELTGGDLTLVVVRKKLFSRVVFQSPRALTAAEMDAVRVKVFR